MVPHAYNWTFTIRPNDIREDRLSRDITESVHALVSRRLVSRNITESVHALVSRRLVPGIQQRVYML